MARIQNGSLRAFTVYRIPVLVHWSWPIGMLWICGGFHPLLWAAFGFLVLAHELGHAYWVSHFRMKTTSILLHGFGGECRYRGDPSVGERAVIAWGGVMAQAIVLAAAVVISPFATSPTGAALAEFFIWQNLWMIGFNLLPIAPLDGAEAWKYPVVWWYARRDLARYLRDRRIRQRERDREVQATRTRRAEKEEGEIARAGDDSPLDGSLPPTIESQFEDAMKKKGPPAEKHPVEPPDPKR